MMGEQRNLTEENVEDLKKQLERMKVDNHDLEYNFFEQKKFTETLASETNPYPSNKDIMDKLESLEHKIDMIFDGHILLDGEFKKITV
jgi:hypothetical protein